MKILKHSWLLLSFLAVAFLAAGCGEDVSTGPESGTDVSGENSLDEIDLDAAYGGLAYTDEAEAFGESALLAEALAAEDAAMSEDEEDSLMDDDPTLENPQYKRTFLRILWGQLDGTPRLDPVAELAEGERVDWSGKVSVTDGAVILKRTILFERPWDHRLPRESRQVLGWHSYTKPHYDGILICVVSPVDAAGVPQGELTFETGPLTRSFAVSDLVGIAERIDVDELGNAVSFYSPVPDPDACYQGFLAGYWHAFPGPQSERGVQGRFLGRWVSDEGMLRGFLMGRYGVNSEGERVFMGKVIGRAGRIRGLVQGTWEPTDDGAGNFVGRWVNRGGEHQGTLMGHYVSRENRGAGFFEGRWQEVCEVDDPAS